MGLSATLTHPDGSTDSIDLTRVEENREFGKVDDASAFVDRPQVNTVTLNEGDDEVTIEDGTETVFAGILREVLRGGGEVELLVESYEHRALDGEPEGGGVRYENASDTTIYQDAIDDMAGLSSGTLENNGSLTMVFSWSSPAKRLREAAEKVDAEISYNADKTIDVVSSLGTDNTTTTLSPANGNISGEFEPTREGGADKITHLVMLGAGEGSAQIQALIVPDADTRNFSSEDKWGTVRTYTAASWSDGDNRKWGVRSNVEITDESTLADHGEVLISELNLEYLDVEITVEDEDVALGDTYHIKHAEENVDDDLRAVEVQRVIDSDGRRYHCTFSNRRQTRESTEDRQSKDTDRHNMAFEGSAVTLTASGGRQPVDSSLNYEFEFYYPDEIEYEHRVELFVKGLAYRAYAKGGAAGGDHSHSVDVTHPSHSHDVTHPSHTHDVTHPSHTHDVTHPSHTHDVTHPDHSHDVTINTTSTDNTDFSNIAAADTDSGTTTYTAGSWNDVDTFSPNANVSYTLCVIQHNPREAGTTLDKYRLDLGNSEYIPDSSGTYALGNSTDGTVTTQTIPIAKDHGSVTLQINPVHPDQTSKDVRTIVFWVSAGLHNHDVSQTKTSTNELGTTETSTTALGTNETSTTALGTTETSTTALGSTETSTTALGTTNTETSDASGDHTHPADPGIVESFSGTTHYPSNCDVLVNGTSMGVSLGDGASEFDSNVDISGELVSGQRNTIEVTSDTLGHIMTHLDVDVYRQIRGQG